MRTVCMFVLCLGMFVCASCTTNISQISQPAIDGLYDDIKQRGRYDVEYPDMYFIFFESSHDSVPRVLAKGEGNRDTNGWSCYDFKDGRWQRSPRKFIDTTTIDPSNCVGGDPDDFFILTEKGQKPKLVVIYEDCWREVDYNKPEEWYVAYRSVDHITIDSKGYLKTIPIPEFSFEKTRFKFEYDESADADVIKDYPTLPLETPTYKLERLPVQTYRPKVAVQPTKETIPPPPPMKPRLVASETTYVVQEGDDIYQIAVRHDATPYTLRKLNNLTSNELEAG